MLSPNKNTAVVGLLSALMIGTTQSHMIMKTPMPYGQLDNSPLSSSGSNYPCKVTSDPATFYSTDGIISQNTMIAGESQTLSFVGSAVHGGGSCQLAITNDMQPSTSTSWRVILSIESGCPSTDGSGPSTYNYTIPAETEPGQYSFAWTWISKLAGQPEYYMNCAPITVTAGSSTKAKRGDVSYPELFVANLESVNTCKTTPGTDVVFPDPGPNAEKLLTGATPSFASISASGCVPLSQTQGSGSLPTAMAGGSGSSGGSSAGTTAAASVVASSSAVASSGLSVATSAQASSFIFAPTGTVVGDASPTTLETKVTSKSSSIYIIPVSHSSTPSMSHSAIGGPSIASTGGKTPPTTTQPASSTSLLASSTPKSSNSTSVSSIHTSALSRSTTTSASSMTALAKSTTASASSTSSSAISTSASAISTSAFVTTTATTATTTATSSIPTTTLSPTGGSSGSSNSTGSAGDTSVKSGPCTDEGMFNCVENNYQQCASGAWTAMRPLSAGTSCQQGESKSLWAVGTSKNKMRKGRRGFGDFVYVR